LRVVGSGPDGVSQGMVPELTSGQASVDRSWLLLWGQAHCTQYDPRGPPQPRPSPADSKSLEAGVEGGVKFDGHCLPVCWNGGQLRVTRLHQCNLAATPFGSGGDSVFMASSSRASGIRHSDPCRGSHGGSRTAGPARHSSQPPDGRFGRRSLERSDRASTSCTSADFTGQGRRKWPWTC
jgi:hypothetical protein